MVDIKAQKRLGLIIFAIAFAFAAGVLFSAAYVGKNNNCVSAPVNGVIATWCSKELPKPQEF